MLPLLAELHVDAPAVNRSIRVPGRPLGVPGFVQRGGRVDRPLGSVPHVPLVELADRSRKVAQPPRLGGGSLPSGRLTGRQAPGAASRSLIVHLLREENREERVLDGHPLAPTDLDGGPERPVRPLGSAVARSLAERPADLLRGNSRVIEDSVEGRLRAVRGVSPHRFQDGAHSPPERPAPFGQDGADGSRDHLSQGVGRVLPQEAVESRFHAGDRGVGRCLDAGRSLRDERLASRSSTVGEVPAGAGVEVALFRARRMCVGQSRCSAVIDVQVHSRCRFTYAGSGTSEKNMPRFSANVNEKPSAFDESSAEGFRRGTIFRPVLSGVVPGLVVPTAPATSLAAPATTSSADAAQVGKHQEREDGDADDVHDAIDRRSVAQPPDACLAEGHEDVDGDAEKPAEGVEPLVELGVPHQSGEVVAGLVEEVRAHDPDVVEGGAEGVPEEREHIVCALVHGVLHGDQHGDHRERQDELDGEAQEPGDDLADERHGELRVG